MENLLPSGEGEPDIRQFSSHDLFQTYLPDLAIHYQELNEALGAELPGLPASRIYVSEYPNPLHSDNGALCEVNPDRPLDLLPGISTEEVAWADQVALTLRGELQMVTAGNGFSTTSIDVTTGEVHKGNFDSDPLGWNFITGIFEDSLNHGYCANDHWFVRLQEAMLQEMHQTGAVHPNRAGHENMAAHIVDALMHDFYSGDSGIRLPEQQVVVDVAGRPDIIAPPVDMEFPGYPAHTCDNATLEYAWSAGMRQGLLDCLNVCRKGGEEGEGCAYFNMVENMLVLPCVTIGPKDYSVNLALESVEPDITLSLAGFNEVGMGDKGPSSVSGKQEHPVAPEGCDQELYSQKWQAGYEHAAAMCNPLAKACSQDTIPESQCAYFDIFRKSLVVPCMNADQDIYRLDFSLMGIAPVSFRLEQFDKIEE